MGIPIIVVFLFSSCTKFLEEKSNITFAIPESFKDLRALMNNESQLNRSFPALIEAGSDDYYVKEAVLKGRREAEQLVYTWKNHSERSDLSSWNKLYNTVLVANVTLEGLKRIKDGSETERKILRGEAMFARSLAFYYLSQLFCLPYDAARKKELLGIPLRTSSDFQDLFERANMEDTYEFIIKELLESIAYLPDAVQYKSRPSKPAAHALLARLYLIMGDYKEANENAGSALRFNNKLMDYSKLNAKLNFPIALDNEELIYYGVGFNGYLLVNNRAFIPQNLYNSYDDRDLRKKIFFLKSSDITFKGNYDGKNSIYFAGFATDELYLIRAECEIRLGRIAEGLDFLNKLLILRFEKGSYLPYKDLDETEALSLVLSERRKELIKRGIRWTDLRRLLNEKGRVSKLMRKADNGIDQSSYTLEPIGKNYTYPIPSGVTDIHAYKQNPL